MYLGNLGNWIKESRKVSENKTDWFKITRTRRQYQQKSTTITDVIYIQAIWCIYGPQFLSVVLKSKNLLKLSLSLMLKLFWWQKLTWTTMRLFIVLSDYSYFFFAVETIMCLITGPCSRPSWNGYIIHSICLLLLF